MNSSLSLKSLIKSAAVCSLFVASSSFAATINKTLPVQDEIQISEKQKIQKPNKAKTHSLPVKPTKVALKEKTMIQVKAARPSKTERTKLKLKPEAKGEKAKVLKTKTQE